MCEKAVNGDWTLILQKDVIRGHYEEDLRMYTYYDRFCIFAKNKIAAYIHFFQFWDNYDLALATFNRIKVSSSFSPEGKPSIWLAVRDTKPMKPPAKRKLKWWIEK